MGARNRAMAADDSPQFKFLAKCDCDKKSFALDDERYYEWDDEGEMRWLIKINSSKSMD